MESICNLLLLQASFKGYFAVRCINSPQIIRLLKTITDYCRLLLTQPANKSKPKSKKQPENITERNSAQTTAFLLSDRNFSHQKIKTKYTQIIFAKKKKIER
jgi:phage FluMu protein Com